MREQSERFVWLTDAATQKMRKKASGLLFGIFRLVIIIGICFVILMPILFMLLSSMKTAGDILNSSRIWLPSQFSWSVIRDNFADAFRLLDYKDSFWGTVGYVLVTTTLQVMSSCVIGYGFARFDFRGRNLLFALVIATFVIPPFTTLVPTFIGFKNFDPLGLIGLFNGGNGVNLLDTYWPFALMCATGMGYRSGLFIFIMRQFFSKIPRELEEAANIDGCSSFKAFIKIMIPCTLGALVTIGLFSLVWQWSDIFYSTIFVSNKDLLMKSLQTIDSKFHNLITVQKSFFPNFRTAADYTILAQASTLLTIAPLLLIYACAQRYFLESIDRTGIVE